VIVGAFEEEELIGVVGLLRGRHAKSQHKLHLWGMYVRPDFRGRGVGADLVRAAIDHARSSPGIAWVQLSVTAAAPAARRLYERAGFRVWGVEPDALRVGDESVEQHHMALRL
jgi:RimJ/RimL family protein N-acetyltransferase